MVLEIFEIEQGSPAWIDARVGIITASRFSDVLTKGRDKVSRGQTSLSYMYEIASERLRGEPAEQFGSFHMNRGKQYESEALRLYQEQTGLEVRKIGFMKDGNTGASADGLIVGSPGGIELKTRLAKLHIKVLLGEEPPTENVAQVQGNMLVSGLEWWDLVSFCPGLPFYCQRIQRDEPYISALQAELSTFDAETEALVTKIKTMY